MVKFYIHCHVFTTLLLGLLTRSVLTDSTADGTIDGRDLGVYFPEKSYSQSTDFLKQYDSPLVALPSEEQPAETLAFSSDSPSVTEESRRRKSNYNPTYSSFDHRPYPPKHHNYPPKHSDGHGRSSLRRLMTIALVLGIPVLLGIAFTTMAPIFLNGFAQLNPQPTGRKRRDTPELFANIEKWLKVFEKAARSYDE